MFVLRSATERHVAMSKDVIARLPDVYIKCLSAVALSSAHSSPIVLRGLKTTLHKFNVSVTEDPKTVLSPMNGGVRVDGNDNIAHKCVCFGGFKKDATHCSWACVGGTSKSLFCSVHEAETWEWLKS